jgi:hypothetical protein
MSIMYASYRKWTVVIKGSFSEYKCRSQEASKTRQLEIQIIFSFRKISYKPLVIPNISEIA